MFVTKFHSAALAFFVAGQLTAADDPFIGKWKFNRDKSKLIGQRVKIEDLGANTYKFDDGAVPQVIIADGTDQPREFGGTVSFIKTGENTWKMVSKTGGRVLSESSWSLSPDDITLTIEATGTRFDGSKFDDRMVVTRLKGTSGLAGTWESKSEKLSNPRPGCPRDMGGPGGPAPPNWEIQPYEGSLLFVYPSSHRRLDIKFDGKDYSEAGPSAPKGIVTSGKRLKSDTIQLTEKHDGKVLDTAEYRVSAESKTLTITIHNTGQKNAIVEVYDRQ
jgi:hypothetical protein